MSSKVRAVSLVAAAIALLVFGREAATKLPTFVEWVRSLGVWGPLGFVAGYGLAAALLMPCFLLTLSAGALWGVSFGLLYAMLGATLGALLAFFCARHLVRQFVQAYVDRHPRLTAIDRAVESEGVRIVMLLRLSPLVPYNLLNYVLGITRVRFRDYVAGLAGMVPTALMYVYAGKVAGDLAKLATGNAMLRGPAYYTLLGVGLASTILASVLIARAAARSVQQSGAIRRSP